MFYLAPGKSLREQGVLMGRVRASEVQMYMIVGNKRLHEPKVAYYFVNGPAASKRAECMLYI